MLPPETPKLGPKRCVRVWAPCPAPRPTTPKAPPMDMVKPLFTVSRLLTLSKSNAVEPCPKAAPPPLPPAPSKDPLFTLVVVVVVGLKLMPAPVKLGKLEAGKAVVGKPLLAPSELGPKKLLKSNASFLAPLRPGDLVSAEDYDDPT
jgi:hypothetical protein